jgi:hypothetical protein
VTPGSRLAGLLLAMALMACAAAPPTSTVPPPTAPPAATSTLQAPTAIPASPNATAAAADPVVLAAGDIAMCPGAGTRATAALVEQTEGTVLALGDEAYPHGTAADFAGCYDPTWGRFKTRTRPVPGNHEYEQSGAASYFRYFGDAAGEAGKGWYSFDLGRWHLVALNSNCQELGGCGPDSEEARWLRADLAAHPAPCTLAFWHHPRFSSGPHGSDAATGALWQALYAAGAELVLSGHDHLYERFAPQNPAGRADPVGLRQFVVGTGGAESYEVQRVRPNSEARRDRIFGILQFVLHPEGYDWRYLPTDGQSFADAGSASCHGPPTTQVG